MRTSMPRALCSSGLALRAGNAHHVAERGEDDIGFVRDGETIVDSAMGSNADGAAGAMDQFDVLREVLSFRPKR